MEAPPALGGLPSFALYRAPRAGTPSVSTPLRAPPGGRPPRAPAQSGVLTCIAPAVRRRCRCREAGPKPEDVEARRRRTGDPNSPRGRPRSPGRPGPRLRLAIWTDVVRLSFRSVLPRPTCRRIRQRGPADLRNRKPGTQPPQLMSPPSIADPVELPRFRPFVARQSESGSLQAALNFLDVRAPHSEQPYSEAVLVGVGAEMGFSSSVFEYKAARIKTLTLGTRITTLEESSRPQFLQTICERVGVPLRVVQSTSPAIANKGVRQALAEGPPPIVWIDLSGAPYHFAPTAEYAAGVVYAWKTDRILLAGRSRRPLPFRRKSFEAARNSIGVPKARAVVVQRPDRTPNLATAVLEAVRETRDQMARGIDVGSFRGNFGLAGLEKWAGLLTDDRDRKGWPRFFPAGRDLLTALLAVFVQIEMRGRGVAAFP